MEDQQTGGPPPTLGDVKPRRAKIKPEGLMHGVTVITQRDGSKRYKLTWDMPRNESGERRRKAKTLPRGTSEASAKKQLVAILAAVNSGRFPEPTKETVVAYLEAWRLARREAGKIDLDDGITQGTAERLRENFAHLTPMLGKRGLHEIDRAFARRVVTKLCTPDADGKRLAPASVRLIVSAVKTAFNHAVDDGKIQSNPWRGVVLPKLAVRDPSAPVPALDVAEIADVLRRVEALNDPPMHALLRVLFGTGLRRAEALALRQSDVALDAGIVRVRRILEKTKEHGTIERAGGKTEGSVRDVPITPDLCAYLGRYRTWFAETMLRLGMRSEWDPATALLFPRDLATPQKLADPDIRASAVVRVVRRLGYPDFTLHHTRHTYASVQLANGAPLEVVSQRLGHASIATTQEVYRHALKSASDRTTELAASLGL